MVAAMQSTAWLYAAVSPAGLVAADVSAAGVEPDEDFGASLLPQPAKPSVSTSVKATIRVK